MMQVMATEPLIGTKIQKRRQVLGMTQEDLAERVGVSRSTVTNWERGKHFPQRYLGRVESILGISLADSTARIIPPQMRKLIRDTLPDDLESQRRVIGLLEGTLTWPDESLGEEDQRGDESPPQAG